MLGFSLLSAVFSYSINSGEETIKHLSVDGVII